VVDLGILEGAGNDVLAAVRAARPIVVTGATDRASRAIAESLAATDYLLKPVELDDLAAAIKRRMK
jgi:ActR/RegA family two-component response regulator